MPCTPLDQLPFNRLANLGNFLRINFPSNVLFNYYNAWTVITSQSWLSIASTVHNGGHINLDPSEGVYYDVAANATGLKRTADLMFVPTGSPGTPVCFSVTQQGDPSYSFSPPSITISDIVQTAGTSLLVDTTQAPAVWFLYTPTPWVFLPGSGRETGIDSIPPDHSPVGVSFSVTANTGTTVRVGQIEVHEGFKPYSADWYNGIIPPTSPPLAIFYINQKPPDTGPPDTTPPADGGTPPGANLYRNPFNLPGPYGWYYRCAVGNDGNIYSWRANNNGPFAVFDDGPTVVTTTADYDGCKMAFEPATRRLFCVFSRTRTTIPAGHDIYQASSDDDAHSWKGATKMIPGGQHPTIATGLDGTIIIAAYVGPVGGPGKIQLVAQDPGSVAFGAVTTLKDSGGADMVVQDSTFHLCQPPKGDRQWIWVLMLQSATEPTEWASGDADASTVQNVI